MLNIFSAFPYSLDEKGFTQKIGDGINIKNLGLIKRVLTFEGPTQTIPK